MNFSYIVEERGCHEPVYLPFSQSNSPSNNARLFCNAT